MTAGPTQESIDPVRYITNHSSGKMGYALAKAAMLRGADVTLVSGPCAIEPPPFVKLVPVVTAKEMFDAVTSVSFEQDIIIKAAAVADYRPANVYEDKVKKTGRTDEYRTGKDRRYPGISGRTPPARTVFMWIFDGNTKYAW